ncbi:GPW/gp25 family protein [Leptolyngbya sp. AN02str]|uniref:GPW/gp25 family protein n=1 Tax=Leptolyngbya sp. AN02str TaxID=3423363 RepID=UPI003D31D4A6
MSDRRYRAWRFFHPDLDAVGALSGLHIASTGTIDMVDGAASVRQAILLLLSTRPGERVMRPAYGCNLHRLVFSPNDDTTAGLAIYYVRQAIDRWEPRIQVIRIDANRNEDDPAQLDIALEYRVRTLPQSETLAFAINLAGE